MKDSKFNAQIFLAWALVALSLWAIPNSGQGQVKSDLDLEEIGKDIQVTAESLPSPETQRSPQPQQNPRKDLAIRLQSMKQDLAKVVPNRKGVLPLSYREAVQMAILNNLKTLSANEQFNEAQGDYLRSLSGLMPNLNSKVGQLRRTSNILAEGLDPSSFPGFPTGVFGPYNSFSARIALLQNIFNLAAIGEFQTGQSGVRLAKLKIILARQMVASTAGTAYVQVLQAEADVKAAEADLEVSKTLLLDTQVGFQAGVITGIDLVRAEANYSENTTRLIKAKAQEKISKLNLKKILLVPMGTSISLTTSLGSSGPPPPSVDQAIAQAENTRPDVQIAKEEIKQRGYQHRAAIGKQVPSLAFGASYGASGSTPTSGNAGVYQLAGQLSIPIFDGGNTVGAIKVAKSKKVQAVLFLGNLLQEVNEEVRVALENLNSSSQEIVSTKKTLELSLRELELAKLRFFEGVGDNLEVVKAQASLAKARDNNAQALANYNTARIQLATALGTVDEFDL